MRLLKWGVGLVVGSLLVVLAVVARPVQETQAATNQLIMEQTCTSPGLVNVAFSWTGNNPFLNEQWFDISSIGNNFIPGTFTGMRLAGGWVQNMNLSLNAGTVYFVRLNQMQPNGVWDPSPLFVITTINCTTFNFDSEADEEAEERHDRRAEEAKDRNFCGRGDHSDVRVILIGIGDGEHDEFDEDDEGDDDDRKFVIRIVCRDNDDDH
jgi:hypothetical protein